VCGRIVQVWDEALGKFVQVYVPTWNDGYLKDVKARTDRAYNVPPGSSIGALVRRGDTELQVLRWGFPIEVQGARGPLRKEAFNTRIEEAQSRPLWRDLVGRSHAVVPAQGFYEWTDRGPLLIRRADADPMLLAAVTGPHQGQECLSILTCAPNAFMRALHDRMPVILEPSAVDPWLAAGESSLALAVASEAPLKARAVSARVGNVANEDASLLDAVPRQGTLG
jgi:putative SOS response-associated peptidase YedK